MDIYLITPFVTWALTGSIKFVINSIKARHLAFRQIGYGSRPSNHSAIVSSTVTLIGLREGIHTAPFGLALTLAFIVMLDACSLRRQIGKQAVALNRLTKDPEFRPLRERMGHTFLEVVSGVVVGIVTAYGMMTLGNGYLSYKG